MRLFIISQIICANERQDQEFIFRCARDCRDFGLCHIEHIPKFRNGTGKILANASTPDFSGASDIILGYAQSTRIQ
jgi:hypothetical protein